MACSAVRRLLGLKTSSLLMRSAASLATSGPRRDRNAIRGAEHAFLIMDIPTPDTQTAFISVNQIKSKYGKKLVPIGYVITFI